MTPAAGDVTPLWAVVIGFQVYQNDWDVQFKEIADALRGSGLDEVKSEPDASALLDQVRHILAADPEQRRD